MKSDSSDKDRFCLPFGIHTINVVSMARREAVQQTLAV